MARLHPMAVYGLLKEFRSAASGSKPIVIAGPTMLVGSLRDELSRGGSAAAVRIGAPDEAAVLVLVLAAPPTEEDERVLRQARRNRVPIVCVLAGPDLEPRVPYVLATDIVRVPAGSGFPIGEIARAIANCLGEEGAALAARLPTLRPAVCESLIAGFSRRAGLLGAAVFVPGADLPGLTLLQLRLVLRIGAAHGIEIDRERLPEILAVIGTGLALRAAARQMLGVVPVAGWVVKGGVAYAGTRALGEAAVRYFAARS